MDLTVKFVVQTCCVSTCGISWAQPEEYDIKKRKDHNNFYCPNGHAQHFTSKSDSEKLSEEITLRKRLQDELTQTTSMLHEIKACAEKKKRRISSLKGVITKMKKNGEKP